jgi:hypothetical protein
MAQGFVKNLNLVESDTVGSDEGILNNLGGLGIADDLRLFDGNGRFISRLINDSNFLGDTIDYGFLIENNKYKIISLGEDRDWSLVGWQTGVLGVTGDIPAEGDVFIASASGDGLAGLSGNAVTIIARTDMTAENDPIDGWTVVTNFLQGKQAFTNGTKLKKDNDDGFDYEVFNSDGETRFQIREIVSGNTLDLSDITTFKLIRSDEITVENILNLIVEGEPPNEDAQPVEIELELYPDPFEEGGRIELIEDVISLINYKKANVVLSYRPNLFPGEDGVSFDGALKITNKPDSSGNEVKVGQDTLFGRLVIGQKYRVTNLADSANWYSVGAGNILSTATQVNSGQFEVGTVYKILNLGVEARGPFTFSVSELDASNNTIDVGSGHNLSENDLVRYTKAADDDDIPNLVSNTLYYIHTATAGLVKLKATVDGDIISFSTTGLSGTGYKLTVDPQSAWNTIGGTSSNPTTYTVGNPDGGTDPTLFKATSNGSTITGALATTVDFTATSKGSTVVSGATARSIDPPGLYINNIMTDTATRAFSGKDNPWQDISNKVITSVAPVGGGAAGPSVTMPALVTSSDVTQTGDFNFIRAIPDEWGQFTQGENYTITEVGSNRDWTGVGAGNATPEVGDVFTASATGSGLSNSGSGGKAIGEPKLIFINDDQDEEVSSDGLESFSAPVDVRGATITHKIPITVNGEIYYLCANSSESEVASGDYRILVIP